MTDETHRDDQARGDSHDDFAEAWDHVEEHDVGADTSQFEAFKDDDTAELLRRQVRDGELPDAPPEPHARPEARRLGSGMIVGMVAAVFVILAVLYLVS